MCIVADLHTHTTASDGLLSPARLVNMAAEIGLEALAVTDHDSLSGIEEAIQAGAKRQITVLPGIELSTDYQREEIHILGYGIDYTHKGLLDLTESLRQSRFLRAEKMVARLNALGYNLTLDDVLRQANDAPPARPHVARALVRKKLVSSVGEAFRELLEKGMPAYAERYKITPAQAIAVIRQAGGMTAWAHPGLPKNESFLSEFIAQGLQGLEVYHPDHSPSQAEESEKLARKYSLFICGGSDFHAPGEKNAKCLGRFGLNRNMFTEFMQNLANKQVM